MIQVDIPSHEKSNSKNHSFLLSALFLFRIWNVYAGSATKISREIQKVRVYRVFVILSATMKTRLR